MTRVELSRWQRRCTPKPGARWRYAYPYQATLRINNRPVKAAR